MLFLTLTAVRVLLVHSNPVLVAEIEQTLDKTRIGSTAVVPDLTGDGGHAAVGVSGSGTAKAARNYPAMYARVQRASLHASLRVALFWFAPLHNAVCACCT